MINATLSTKPEKSNGTLAESNHTMKGLIYNGPNKIEWKEVPKPVLEAYEVFGNAAKEKAMKVILTN
ncbi:MAG: hypothetical protein ACJA08_003314 [Cyclobacteriaceae bacterium]|jgi:hypothetical protein